MSQLFRAKFPVYALVQRKKNSDEIDRFFGMAVMDAINPTKILGCMPLFSTAEKSAEFFDNNRDVVGRSEWGYAIESKADFLAVLERMQGLKCWGVVVDPPVGTDEPLLQYPIDDLIEQMKAE
jgi:hypothetical protein